MKLFFSGALFYYAYYDSDNCNEDNTTEHGKIMKTVFPEKMATKYRYTDNNQDTNVLNECKTTVVAIFSTVIIVTRKSNMYGRRGRQWF